MAIVIPEYLSKKTIPLASDIFYHKNITFFLPTGFHPIEINNVLDFPLYCKENDIALPHTIWSSCRLYFDADIEALECLKILEPFRNKFIKFVLPVYPRGRNQIDECKVILRENPAIYESLKAIPHDTTLVSRELLSHILYEIFLEEGYEGAVKYINQHITSQDDFRLLIAAVLINRLKSLSRIDTSILMYNHSWYPVFHKLLNLLDNGQDTSNSDVFLVEHFQYKLFEEILYPVFGYCDTNSKNQEISKIATDKEVEINNLRSVCMSIAEEVVLLPTKDMQLKQKKLSDLLNIKVVEPLEYITNKPSRDIRQMVRDFTLDSTVVGGILATLETLNPEVLKIALTAGAISASARYLLRDQSLEKSIPSQIILDGMKKMRVDHEQIQNDIKKILIDQVYFPEKWS